ncbi:UvrD-helicase domain-containing protein [Actinomycetospora sp. NBRC 106378]|uniref:UvrD-helicase domain-containing protein n=1 Tax=Actinomycetospora sp. NBRC 106378 TaxID=3032208 RepID=UPI00249FB515|nr:UvrD-helicase domain-containing protein [Actinomycetospora sp. NBRC 106378]GLZ51349.1 ATP-dependent DNA helicase [Actinomycetospora sp. NBRC 106378]
MTTAVLPDDDVRDRIRNDLDSTLFVDAGAGSGKTTVLVDRIVRLVESGVPLRHIAAVTFTEKAAAELRDRLRESLEEAGLDDACRELDGAAIGTLHSFARRILSEHPLEVRLPPLVDVLDDVGSQVAADRWWRQLQIELLDDDETAPLIRLGLAADMKLDHLRELVMELEANWDLVEERLADAEPPPRPHVNIGAYLARARALLERRRECTDPSDRLLARFPLLEDWVRQAEATDDEAQLLDLIDEIPAPGGNVGKAPAWGGQVASVRSELKSLSDDGRTEQASVMDQVVRCLLPRLAREVLTAAENRVCEGRLRFHDLLVLARRLVRRSSSARRVLQDRYQRLLLDEAQDTDPIQVELAVRIAGGETAEGPWPDVAVPAGALFFVGDGKQSIYRFRRADIAIYLEAQRLGETVALTTNFRSSPAVLDWINAVFGRLIVDEPGVQPEYRALDVGPNRSDGCGSVTVLGSVAHPGGRETTVDDLRQAEARDIAGLIVTALREGWRVADRSAGWIERPLRPDDITILLPTRNAIFAIESELDEAGIPYRTEAASIVYSAAEVRELMTCLRAVDDPTDELAVVATLRSSLFGCSDVELWRWRQDGESWNLFAPRAGSEPVGSALDQLRDWSRARSRLAPAELLDLVLEQRRVLEVAADSPRYREVWRRLRFVVDQARAWSEAERGSLREYLAWAARQADDSVRVTETVLPETDTRTVRITTIHASKGLQFPFVIVGGLWSPGYQSRPTVLWPSSRGVEVALSAKLRTTGYADVDVVEKAIEHGERLRLLYVACTRAESRLAVSLHRKETPPGKEDPACVSSEVLARAAFEVPSSTFSTPGPSRWFPEAEPARPEPPPWESWSSAHTLAVNRSAAREAVSATAIAHREVSLPSFPPGLAKDPVDLELPPWRKGRYGEAFGRAVHAVLQTIDLATGDGLRDLAESQALAEGVVDAVDDVEAAVQSALGSEVVQRAALRPHWRETYVGTMVDGKLVEGYIDLLYRDDDGLVIVDFKTDSSVTPETLVAYERQLHVYERALSNAAGETVVRSFLLFPRPGGAVARQTSPIGEEGAR